MAVAARRMWMGRWWADRGPVYLGRRALRLTQRYGVRPAKAEQRTRAFVEALAARGCRPTLAAPGRVVARHEPFVRELAGMGVEIAVHAYDHLDFHALRESTRAEQLTRAVAAFRAAGLPITGFRCPYLSYEPEMSESVPRELRYSSNRAVAWRTRAGDAAIEAAGSSATLATLEHLYAPTSADDGPVIPHVVNGILEIPVSLPDDLQLIDGMELAPEIAAEAWIEILERTRERGDVFVALMHPETADHTSAFFDRVLARATASGSGVWIAPLIDIADWWNERAAATVVVEGDAIRIECTERTVVLARGVDGNRPPSAWTSTSERSFDRSRELPLVGLAEEGATATALRNDGYAVATGPLASSCATFIDSRALRDLSPNRIIERVAATGTPMIRFARWPSGAGSAFALTGDLDALDLGDYLSRVTALGA